MTKEKIGPAQSVESPLGYHQFMGIGATVMERPMDHLTRVVKPGEAADLVYGCNLVAGIIQKVSPGIVFYPQRGAGPLDWMTATILEERGLRSPLTVDLPLGTHTYRDEQRQSGIKGSQKIRIVSEVLKGLENSGAYVPGVTKLMIVDEVQKGGTITQAAYSLKRAQAEYDDELPVTLVAVQDIRGKIHGDQRNKAFLELAGNQKKGFLTYTVPVNLFTVDRSFFLDALAIDEEVGDSPYLGPENFQIISNTESREVFCALARAFCAPERAMDELAMIREERLAPDIGRATLQYPVVDAITDPRSVGKRTADDRIVKWWSQYIRQASKLSRIHSR